MDAAGFQVEGGREGGGGEGAGEGEGGGREGLGGSVEVGPDGVGGGRHVLGACVGAEGLCRVGAAVWVAVEFRLRTRQGMP